MRIVFKITLAAMLTAVAATRVPAQAPPKSGQPGTAKSDRLTPADKVWKADDVKALIGQDGKPALVRGKVEKVYVPDSRRSVVLNFGKDPKTCFKAVIFARSFDKFPSGIDGLRNYEGKTVTIEGSVSLFEKLPQIVVNVPAQIRE